MLVYLGTTMKQYLVLVGRRTPNGHSIVGRGRSLASIPILLCALMLLLSACGGEPDLHDSETLSRILAEAVDEGVLQKRGEENVVYVPNESEPYTGWAKKMYRNGTQVRYLWHYENGGLRRGVEWYEDGQMESEGQYENGERTGQWVEWYKNGQMRYEGQYENGEETGRWVEWYKNGQMKYEGQYENGGETGRWVEWDEKGEMKYEGQYENGERTGRWVGWDESGQMRLEGHYENGGETGRWVGWYANGQMGFKGHYNHTDCRQFHISELHLCGETGRWVRWYASGQKASEGHYENGHKTGQWVEWDETGQIFSKKHY